MSRIWPAFLLLAIAQPALAGGRDAPAYGPMKRWHGIGYKFGYEDRVEKDGSWRIDAATHGGADAIDVALYRAAERARDAGYRYVALLGGRGSRSPGIDAATLYARPSHDAVPPVGCRSRKVTSCYTADVAEILRILGGPGGTQPGVAIIDHYDEFGREVRMSGYGTGAVATLVPGGHAVSHVTTITEIRSKPNRTVAPQLVSMPAAPIPPAPTSRSGFTTTRSTIAQDRFEQARRANQPVRGGNPAQGWTISD